MQIKRIEEFKLSKKADEQIRTLLQECFPAYPKGQSFYKQIPAFRFLVYDKKKLVGHLAVHYRMMNIGGLHAPTLGVSDLCVANSHRSKTIASTLLNELELLGKKNKIDFIILVAQNHKLYKKNGYKMVNNTSRWLLINGHQSLGVMHGQLERCIMVKPIGDKKWNKGILDFLGPIF